MNLESIRYVYLRRGVGTVLGALGLDVTRALTGRLARGVFELNTAGRRRAEARLRDALGPDVPAARITAIVANVYDHAARFWTEALFARRLLRDASWRRFVRIENEPTLRRMARARRGCLLATATYGNPAVGAYALGHIFRPIHVIVDTSAQPVLRAWQRELYVHRWVRPIDRREAAATVPDVLRRGGAVMMICEHERPRGRAVPARFLGRTLHCYPTLGRLARWFDVPIGIFTCQRGGDGGFFFVLELHDTVRHEADRSSNAATGHGDARDAVAVGAGLDHDSPDAATPRTTADCDGAIVRRVMAVLDRAIRTQPEQYLWMMPTVADRPTTPRTPERTASRPPVRVAADAARPDGASPPARTGDGDRVATETGSESVSCRTARQTGSASQWTSAAGTGRAGPAEAAEPAPTA